MKFKNKIFYFVTVLQIIIAVCVGKYLYDKKINERKVLGEMRIAVIDKNKIDSSPQDDLQYFFEYQPNENIEDNPGWLGYKVVYKINSDGLNERFDYDVEKEEGTFRIVTLGDSFTFGLYVNTEDNWTELLEDKLNKEIKNNKISKFEVINLGMPGYDVQYIVKRHRMKSLKYSPDLILWFESSTGALKFVELMTPIANDCGDKLSEESEKENIAKTCWEKAEEDIKRLYSKEELYGILKIYWKEFLALRKETSFIYFGNLPDDYELFINDLLDNCENCYLYSDYLNLSNELSLADGHPNEKGHLIITEHIFDYLVDNDFVK